MQRNKIYIGKMKEFDERFLVIEKSADDTGKDKQRCVVCITKYKLQMLLKQFDNPKTE